MRRPVFSLLALGCAGALLAPAGAGAAVSSGHSGWQWGNPLPQGNTLRSLAFVGPRGYAAGDFGTVLRTDDGGSTWTGIQTGITMPVIALRAIDADSLVIGGGCSLRRSDDAGQTFRRLPLSASDFDCPSNVVSFSFPSASSGYVLLADNSVFATTDGGQTFGGKTAVPAGAGQAMDIAFVSETTGLAATAARVFRTTDGAGSWTEVPSSADKPGDLRSLTMVTAEVGYAVGTKNTVLKTTDGGQTFAPKPIPGDLPERTLMSIRCADADTCLIATAEGDRVFRTTDGGDTYTAVTPATDRIFAAGFASATRAVAVGANGVTTLSDDAGQTFTPIGGSIPPASVFSRLRATTGSLAYAAGSNGFVARTTTGGQGWELLRSATNAHVLDVAFPTDTTGFALDAAGRLQRTDNGGQSWKVLDTGTDTRPQALLVPGAPRILLIGPRGIRRSGDGGNEFSPVPGLTGLGLDEADRVGAFLWAHGTRALVASTNGGLKWQKLRLPRRSTRVRTVDFVGPNRGFLVDTAGRLWTTRNRGRSWKELVVGNASGYDLSFRSNDRGHLAVAQFGGRRYGWVLRTEDGGRTWAPQLIGPTPLADDGLDSAGNHDYALLSPRSFFFTTTGGVAGKASALALRAAQRAVTRRQLRRQGGRVQLQVSLPGAQGGEQVVISSRRKGSSAWTSEAVEVRSNGKVSTRVRIRATTTFVAQWAGDADNAGDGTKPVTVTVRR